MMQGCRSNDTASLRTPTISLSCQNLWPHNFFFKVIILIRSALSLSLHCRRKLSIQIIQIDSGHFHKLSFIEGKVQRRLSGLTGYIYSDQNSYHSVTLSTWTYASSKRFIASNVIWRSRNRINQSKNNSQAKELFFTLHACTHTQ